MKNVIGAQGEVVIIRINAIPAGIKTRCVKKDPIGYIISHSESGHHHVLTGGTVMERISDVPAGMKIFYAILEKPEEFFHNAPHQHAAHALDPSIYEFRISREYNPFLEEARIVQD